MNIYTVRLITFSPTHTSKQVGEAIVRGTGISDVTRTDLTFHPAGKLEIPENTLTVITVPVYGGKGAPPALERVKDVHASGAPAGLGAVDGNPSLLHIRRWPRVLLCKCLCVAAE